MISLPDKNELLPQRIPLSSGRTLYSFPGGSADLVRLDLVGEFGTAYQPQLLVAAAANRLATVASHRLDSRALAGFLDYRGIIVDCNTSLFSSSTSFYALRKYMDELLPVVEDLVRRPAFPADDFEVYRARKRNELDALRFKARERARRLFFRTLKGPDTLMGRYADVADADRLSLDAVRSFHAARIHPGDLDIILSGSIDDNLIALVDSHLGSDSPSGSLHHLSLDNSVLPDAVGHRADTFDAAQTALRVGRLIPLPWSDPEFADLLLLTTLLGGHFGSRLMGNLREDKGFTYGVHAHVQLYRGTAVFSITTEVAPGTADSAEAEIARELHRLCRQPIPSDELEHVKVVFAGDFLRSVDGVFERAERFSNMMVTHIDERFTDNLRHTLLYADSPRLQQVARRWLNPDTMLFCRAGH